MPDMDYALSQAKKELSQTKEKAELLRQLLRRAQEEMRLIRMKDCGVIYDSTLRTEIAIALDE